MARDYRTGPIPLYPAHVRPYSIESPGCTKVPGETIPRRHPKARDGLIDRPAPEVRVVFDIVRRTVRLYPNNRAVGSRKLIKVHRETTVTKKKVAGETVEVPKEWQYFELSDYSFITYQKYLEQVLQLGSGLRKLGLEPGSRLHFFAATSAQWIAMSHGCASQNISLVTAYDSLGEAGLEHTLLESQPTVIFIDPHLLSTAAGPLKRPSQVKTVIVNEESIFATAGDIEAFKTANPDLRVLTFQDLRQLGEENMVDTAVGEPEDLYCIMYTSGSGGTPKGVCMTNEGLVSSVAGFYACESDAVSEAEVLLAYLPLAHIMEMNLEYVAMLAGACLCYGSPRTLADTSTRNCPGDMRAARPSLLVGVPQVWETIKKGVIAKVDSAGPIAKTLFWTALAYKGFMVRNQLPGANMFDKIVFSKVREQAGGRLRWTMTGGSDVAVGTKEFISFVMAPMIIGYGLTETSATGFLGSPLEYTKSSMGPPAASVEVKLVSVPEMGYSADAEVPQGEVWIRGKSVMKSYLNNPAETEKAITADGWFKTGDVGEFNRDGHLRIIDRIKNLVKMQGGEYIALEKLETVYRGARTVTNLMVHVTSQMRRPIAVIWPNEKVLPSLAKELDVEEADMYTSDKVRQAILDDLQATGKRGGLTAMEIVDKVIVTDVEWLPPSGLVTATQKLNRRAIAARYEKAITAAVSTE